MKDEFALERKEGEGGGLGLDIHMVDTVLMSPSSSYHKGYGYILYAVKFPVVATIQSSKPCD